MISSEVSELRTPNRAALRGTKQSRTPPIAQRGAAMASNSPDRAAWRSHGIELPRSRSVDDNQIFTNDENLGLEGEATAVVTITGAADNVAIENLSSGIIDAGVGNSGAGIYEEVGSGSEDANSRKIEITNYGTIAGRGTGNGIGFSNGLDEGEATVTGSIFNYGTISAEIDAGGAIVVQDGVAFNGIINNRLWGEIEGDINGIYVGNARHNLRIKNSGEISSDSRAVNLDGDNVTLNNSGQILGTGDQRNGTIYLDGTADGITINSSGTIDAGAGNSGSGISAEIGEVDEDATSENIVISNRGSIRGRGADNVPAGIRFFSGLTAAEGEATVTAYITNFNIISTEAETGTVGRILVEDGVAFDGTIANRYGGEIEGPNNGLYIVNADHDLTILNAGTISSDSRAVNLDGDNVTLNNSGQILGTGDQRNGNIYLDGTADGITINSSGTIDAGAGNSGSGISAEIGEVDEDATSENIVISNRGSIRGRGADNVPAGIRFFSGLTAAEGEATVTAYITNFNIISTEAETGTVGGILVEDGVAFDGTITNSGEIEGPNNSLYIGNADHDLTILNAGTISSDSRAVNLDGNGVTLINTGQILKTGDQRNGTIYLDGTADGITINSSGTIDAGAGNSGSGISAEIGEVDEDATSENIVISNQGSIRGRGADNVPAGIRFFSGTAGATVTGSITNSGTIASEESAGILIQAGVAFNGTITNEAGGTITGGNGNAAIHASGSLGSINVVNNGTLNGDVLLGGGSDSFTQNSGTAVTVSLGAAADTFVATDSGSADAITDFDISEDAIDVSAF